MRLILILFAFLISLNAEDIKLSINTNTELNYNEQKELIQLLKNRVKNTEKKIGAFELGLIYEDGILDTNNKEKPNIQEAKRYYILAYENSDYRSVFKLTNFLLQEKKEKKSLEILKKAINYTNNKSLLISAITTYGTIALDFFSKDKDVIIDAIYNYNKLSKEDLDNTPTTKFIKATLLATAGNIVEGEKLLNEACYSPKAPNELKRKCFNPENFELVKEDVKKSVNEPCCTVLEQ